MGSYQNILSYLAR